MKPIYRRVRRRKPPFKSEGIFSKKESQETFFGITEHDSFFKPAVTQGAGESVQRKCEKCEEEEKQVKRQPEKNDEEKKVMRAGEKKEEEKVMKKEDKKEEEKIQREPEKKDEDKKVMRAEEKKEEEKVMKKEEKKEEEKLQREPEKKEDEKLQKKEATSSGGGGKTVNNYISSLNGRGESLPPATNQFFSTRMGYNFSDVRVHKDKEAAESAKAVNAKAYAVGNNIVFNEGQFNTNSAEGKKLMAHELAHVMQNAPEENLSRKKTIAQEKGIDVDTQVGSSMPAVIDAIFAASSVLKPYINVKSNLIAEKGKFKINIGYENLKIAYTDCHGADAAFDGTIGGFFCRKTGVIHTVAGGKKEPTSVFGDVIHEAIHKKSSKMLANILTEFIGEGVTQYFADKVLIEQGLGQYKGHKYGPQLKCAEDLIRVASEDEVAKFYFQGKGSLIDVLNQKFSKELANDNFNHITSYVRKNPSPGFFCTMLKNKQ